MKIYNDYKVCGIEFAVLFMYFDLILAVWQVVSKHRPLSQVRFALSLSTAFHFRYSE
jgi:hypothetical protein